MPSSVVTLSRVRQLVVRRTGIDIPWTEGRDLWWDQVVPQASTEHTPEAFDSEQPLFLRFLGLVFIGCARRGGATRVQRHVFPGDRAAVRAATVAAALVLAKAAAEG